MGRKQQYDTLMDFIARVQGATGLTTPHIERAINSGLDITKATPADVYKFATGLDLPGPAQVYVPPAKQNLSAAIDMPAFHERPYVQDAVRMALPAVERLDPALAARVRAGEPDAFMEVMQLVAKNKGELPVTRAVDPFENIAAADMGDLPQEFAPMSDAQHAYFVKARQMELGLAGDNEIPSTALVPFGFRGPGAAVGGVSGPGVSSPVRGDMILARLMGLPEPQRPRLPGSVIDAAAPSKRGMNPLAATALAAAAAGTGSYALSRLLSEELTDASSPSSSPLQDEDLTLADDTDSLTEVGNPAELVAEVSPPPSVNEMLHFYDGVRQDFTPDREDVIARSKASLLPGTMVSPSQAIRELRVGGMNPLTAQRINDATQAVIDAERAIQRYNQNNNPWRGYGRLRPTR